MAIFRQMHRMNPKWPQTLQGQRYPIRILRWPMTSKYQSNISICFAPRPAVFKLQAIFRQVNWITPKWPWTLKRPISPIDMLQLPMANKCPPVSLYGQAFSSYRPFWDKCIKWSQNDLEYYKVKGTPFTYTTTYDFQNFTPPHSMACRFRVTGHFETSLSKD